MLITSLDNNRIKNVRKLLDKKYSISSNLFIIEGEHLVNEALSKNLLKELYVLDGHTFNTNFSFDTVSENVMKSLSDMKSTPRVIGVCEITSKSNIGKRILVLDCIQDPGNAGTMIRSAVAFGIDTVIFSKDSVSPYNIKVIRSTQGMIFKLNIIIGDLKEELNKIKELNIPLIGTSLDTENSIESLEKLDSYAVVFGNEGNGISEETKKNVNKLVKINMNSSCESLNVGVSCGIILYHLYGEKK